MKKKTILALVGAGLITFNSVPFVSAGLEEEGWGDIESKLDNNLNNMLDSLKEADKKAKEEEQKLRQKAQEEKKKQEQKDENTSKPAEQSVNGPLDNPVEKPTFDLEAYLKSQKQTPTDDKKDAPREGKAPMKVLPKTSAVK